MDFEEKTLKRTEIFDGQIFKVCLDEVELPNNLGTSKRELVFHKGAVAVLAVTDEGKIILVKQYRKAIESVSYEIPAGKLEEGEAGFEQEAASRELEEETGYQGQLTPLYTFYTAIGFSNEKITLYLADKLKKWTILARKMRMKSLSCLSLAMRSVWSWLRLGRSVTPRL